MTKYEVIDLRCGSEALPSILVEAHTPEGAAEAALGVRLVRGRHGKDLLARVYWDVPGQPRNMVRLYANQALGK